MPGFLMAFFLIALAALGALALKAWFAITLPPLEANCDNALTVYSNVSEAGPRDKSFQCLIERDTKTSTFRLWQGPPQADGAPAKNGWQFLLSARHSRRLTGKKYIISSRRIPSKRSDKKDVVGKIRSNFLKTKFTIYESQQPPHTEAVPYVKQTSGRRSRYSKVSPHIENQAWRHSSSSKVSRATSVEVGHVVVRRSPPFMNFMECTLLTIPGCVINSTGNATKSPPTAFNEDLVFQVEKCGKDRYLVDYFYPLSAFQAFAIFLSSDLD